MICTEPDDQTSRINFVSALRCIHYWDPREDPQMPETIRPSLELPASLTPAPTIVVVVVVAAAVVVVAAVLVVVVVVVVV